MGKLETFEILFTHPQGVFFAGQVFSGNVHVVLGEPMKMRGISMRIFGKGKVHWSVASGKTRKHYRSEEIYCDWKIDLCPESASEDCLTLPAGSFMYPFQMALPPSLPSSFEGKYGYVRYTVEAKIDRPWKFDHDLKTAFTVLSILDLSLEPPSLKVAYQATQEKDVSCCLCCISGLVDAMVTVNRRCFVPGETIYISLKVRNNSNSPIQNCSAMLNQNIQFLAQSTNFFSSGQYHSKIRSEELVRIDLDPVASGATEEFNNVSLVVPSIPPSRLVGCQIININYFLTVDISVDYSEFKFPVEIVIGTIPLREQYAPCPAITTQPTALLPLQDFNSDQPPPFSSLSGIFHDMPPSYEECVQGKVTIKEETDSQYVRGDLNWAPVYPMYRQPSSN